MGGEGADGGRGGVRVEGWFVGGRVMRVSLRCHGGNRGSQHQVAYKATLRKVGRQPICKRQATRQVKRQAKSQVLPPRALLLLSCSAPCCNSPWGTLQA